MPSKQAGFSSSHLQQPTFLYLKFHSTYLLLDYLISLRTYIQLFLAFLLKPKIKTFPIVMNAYSLYITSHSSKTLMTQHVE